MGLSWPISLKGPGRIEPGETATVTLTTTITPFVPPGPPPCTTPLPGLSITSDQGHGSYELGALASVTITASGAGLTSNPSASHVPISTATPGTFAVSRTAVGECGATTASFAYTVIPPPVLGKTVNVNVVSGKVFVAIPSTAHASLAGPQAGRRNREPQQGRRVHAAQEARQIPVGSFLDTSAGVARITTATATKGKLQFGDFGAGIFKLLQRRQQRGLTELNIIDNRTAPVRCARRAARRGRGEASEQQGARPDHRQRARALHHSRAVQRGDGARDRLGRSQPAATVHSRVSRAGLSLCATSSAARRSRWSPASPTWPRRRTSRLRCEATLLHMVTYAAARGDDRGRGAVGVCGRTRARRLGAGGDVHGRHAERSQRGTCNNPASGTCSLRQLIEYENGLQRAPQPVRRDRRSRPAPTALTERRTRDHTDRSRSSVPTRARPTCPSPSDPGRRVRLQDPKQPHSSTRASSQGSRSPAGTRTKSTARSAATSSTRETLSSAKTGSPKAPPNRGGDLQ